MIIAAAAAVARAARDLITDEQRHAIGTWARDADHNEVPWWSDEACAWCYFGALRRAAWEHLGQHDITVDPEQPVDAAVTDPAVRLAEHTHRRIVDTITTRTGRYPVSLALTNDRPGGHQRVLDHLDSYLALAERVSAA